MSKWNKDQTLTLINLYRQNPILYDANNASYLNKTKCDKAYETILKKIDKVKKNITLKEVKKKMNTLKGQFSRESLKVRYSEENSSGNIYIPKLWCYNQLKFLQKPTKDKLGESIIALEISYITDNYVDEDAEAAEIKSKKSTRMTCGNEEKQSSLRPIKLAENFTKNNIEAYNTSSGIGYHADSDDDEDVQLNEKLPRMTHGTIKRKALAAIDMAKNMAAKQIKEELSREYEFCGFLRQELKKITIDDIYEETQWQILDIVKNAVQRNTEELL